MVWGRYKNNQHKIIHCCLLSHLLQEKTKKKPNPNIYVNVRMDQWIKAKPVPREKQ